MPCAVSGGRGIGGGRKIESIDIHGLILALALAASWTKQMSRKAFEVVAILFESENKKPRNKMKNIKTKLAAWIGLLAVCLLPTGARAAGNPNSGIIGFVETHNWNVEVLSEGNNPPIYVQPDRDGFFYVDLPPGTYVLIPFTYELPTVGPGQLTPNIVTMIHGPARTVKVAKNRF